MKYNPNTPPREFIVGKGITIKDSGKIHLETDEMVSFQTKSGKEYDFTAKSWGFYATPSINGRLKSEGFKSALVKNGQGRVFLMTVEESKLEDFQKYLDDEEQEIVQWLDEWTESE
jgi:hypothetical protein